MDGGLVRQLGDERAGVATRDDRDLARRAGDGDMEQAALLLVVLRQPVWEQVGLCHVHDDVWPLLTLDAMHRGEHDSAGVAAGEQRLTQPLVEASDFGMQRGDLAEGCQVVALRTPIHPVPVVVERGDSAAQPDLVHEHTEQLNRVRSAGGERSHTFDVAGEIADLCRVLVAEPISEAQQPLDGRLLRDPLAHARAEAARWPAGRFGEVLAPQVSAESRFAATPARRGCRRARRTQIRHRSRPGCPPCRARSGRVRSLRSPGSARRCVPAEHRRRAQPTPSPLLRRPRPRDRRRPSPPDQPAARRRGSSC